MRLWRFLTRRKESGPEGEDRPLCAGLAAAPVHEIQGPILAYPLSESSAEDDVVFHRVDPPPLAGALQEVTYEHISDHPDHPDHTDIPDLPDLPHPRAPPAPPPAGVRSPREGRASDATLWLRWHLSAVATAFLFGWDALAGHQGVHASGARACGAEVMRFVAWEQWNLERLLAPRHLRLPCIARFSLMWGIGMIFVSGATLAIWYSDEFGNKSDIPLAFRVKMILPLLPLFLFVHIADGMSALIMYRAYIEIPHIRRRAREQRRRVQLMEEFRRREEQSRISDGSSSSNSRSMVNVPLPESTLNMSEAENEQESQRRAKGLPLRTLRQNQQPQAQPQQQPQEQPQTPPGPSSQPPSEQGDGDSGREADIESSESSLRQSPLPPPNSKSILRQWLFTATLSYIAYIIGMVVAFITGDTYVALFLLFAIVAGVLPTIDVFAEYCGIDERQRFEARTDAELTHSSTFGREMVNFAEGFSGAPRKVNERTPLLTKF